MLHNMLKGVFLAIGCAVVAAVLYYALFGGNAAIFRGETFEARDDWEGALFFAARQAEHPISAYYYKYCYIPSVHTNDYVDASLGGSVAKGLSEIYKTKSSLAAADSDNVSFGGSYSHWSDGWH